MRIAAYIRVSTDRQAEDGWGLEVQRSCIQKWAAENGHSIIRWCSDEGVSGTVDALDREGLGCVLAAIEGGLADGLVVARLDRLARRLHVQEAALAHVWRSGGKVFSVDGGEVLCDDPEDPMRTAMRQMIGVFGELERSMIAKRMREGRRAKAQAGGFAYGAPPFGFRAEGRELVPDPAEQRVLEEIQSLRAGGSSFQAIADQLNADGIPTKRGTSTAASRWHRASVRRALERVVK